MPCEDFLELIGLEKGNYSLKVLPFFPARLSGESEGPDAISGPSFDNVAPILCAARRTQYGPNIALLRKPL